MSKFTIRRKIRQKIKTHTFLNTIFKYTFYAIMRFLFATYRLHITYDPHLIQPLQKQPGIYYFWHQQIIAGMLFFFKSKSSGYCVVSPSNDGKFAGFACKKLGFNVLYGSSHKSSIKLLRQCLSVLNKNQQLCLVGDGSRGPAFTLQKGISYLATKSNLPLIFVDAKPQWAYTLKKSWDKFQIPLPFSKISIHVHKHTKLQQK